MTLYLRVGELTRLTTGSTRISWILSESGQKLTYIELCKKNSTQSDSNPWWVRLARGFQPILIALIVHISILPTYLRYRALIIVRRLNFNPFNRILIRCVENKLVLLAYVQNKWFNIDKGL